MRKMFSKNEIKNIVNESALSKPRLINFGEYNIDSEIFVLDKTFNLEKNHTYLVRISDDEENVYSFVVMNKGENSDKCYFKDGFDEGLLIINYSSSKINYAAGLEYPSYNIVEIFEI